MVGWQTAPVLDPESEIVVVSDLHMGRGKNPETGRFFGLETFFYDDDFASFCRFLCGQAAERNGPFTLVLNGDILDLLRVDPEPTASGSMTGKGYGEPNTPQTAPHVVADILDGHPGFVRAIVGVLRRGHFVVMLAGNHDLETQWEPVREVIRGAIRDGLNEESEPAKVAAAIERLVFRSWFYYVPGRIWIEHGCQYDPANAFKYPLRGNLGELRDTVFKAEQDMPLGNFFQRYLYNGFGPIAFIVPDARANFRYFRWFLLNAPRFLFRVLRRHLPFAVQVLRRFAKSAEPERVQLERAHQDALSRIGRDTGLGDRLFAIDSLKEAQGDAVQAVRVSLRQILKTAGVLATVMALGVGAWFAGLLAISELQTGFGLRTLLFLTLNILMLAGVVGTVTWRLVRGGRGWRGKPLVRAAHRIAEIVDVPLVVFGHTHVENVVRLVRWDQESAWYFNTGTWIAVFRHDELVPRDRVQYSFLRVRGTAAELLHWSPGRGEALPVVLLDDPPLEL